MSAGNSAQRPANGWPGIGPGRVTRSATAWPTSLSASAEQAVLVEGNSSEMQRDLLVIGLGYVGLPLAREATTAGLSVLRYDADQAIVYPPDRGSLHVDDIPAVSRP